MSIADLKASLGELKEDYQKRSAQREILDQTKKEEVQKMFEFTDEKMQLEKIQTLLVNTADNARQAGKERLERVVTRALQSVFGPEFSFEIELSESGGRPIANFYAITPDKNGNPIRNEPQTSRGGGINDIIAFALQVAVMVVYNSPKIQGPIILDEPGKHVSEEYVVKFGEFLDFISKTFNRQIFMVTHQPHLAQTADKTLVSQIIGGESKIKEYVPHESQDESYDGSEEGV